MRILSTQCLAYHYKCCFSSGQKRTVRILYISNLITSIVYYGTNLQICSLDAFFKITGVKQREKFFREQVSN